MLQQLILRFLDSFAMRFANFVSLECVTIEIDFKNIAKSSKSNLRVDSPIDAHLHNGDEVNSKTRDNADWLNWRGS